MRLFLAIELPNAVQSDIVETIRHALEAANIRAPVSWVKPQYIHITLKFLGEMPDNRIPALCDASAKMEPPGEMMLWASHVECFPPRGPVRVVSAGFAGDIDKLRTLFNRIESASEQLGFPREHRKFTPHATALRARNPLRSTGQNEPSLQKLLDEKSRDHFPGPRFSARQFVLMHSQPHPRGAIYTPAARFSLSGSSTMT